MTKDAAPASATNERAAKRSPEELYKEVATREINNIKAAFDRLNVRANKGGFTADLLTAFYKSADNLAAASEKKFRTALESGPSASEPEAIDPFAVESVASE